MKKTVFKSSPDYIKIVGLILSESFQKCKLFTHRLRKYHAKRFKEPSVNGFLEADWLEYLHKLQREIGGQTWAVRHGVVVFINDKFIGGEKELFGRYNSCYMHKIPTAEKLAELAKQEYCNFMNRNNLLYTYLELSLDNEYMGTLVFQLRPDLLPKTATWFAMLCDTENHLGFSYRGTTVHRVCRRGWFQAGELGVGPSSGFLEDESFCYKHDRRGTISFANDGKDSNRCQFFVTFKPSSWMDEYYVAFGRLVEGCDVLRRIENTRCTYENPDHSIVIAGCGIAEVGLGRNLVTKLKIKGITVGEPHIQLNTFMDLVLDSFCEVLFERLDAEQKRQIHGEWISQMVWESILPYLMVREPVEDIEDVHDRSSSIFKNSRFLAGLYGLQDIPDLWIVDILEEIIDRSAERSDTQKMAASIVEHILENIRRSSSHTESSDECEASVIKSISKVMLSVAKKKAMFGKSISKIVDSSSVGMLSVLSESLSTDTGTGTHLFAEEEASSTTNSVIGYILDILINSLTPDDNKLLTQAL